VVHLSTPVRLVFMCATSEWKSSLELRMVELPHFQARHLRYPKKIPRLKGRLIGLLHSSIDTMFQPIEKALQAKFAWFGVKAALLSNLAQTPKTLQQRTLLKQFPDCGVL
jgi:hypothetical protein